MSTDLMTPRQVADLLGVSPITVRQWANLGWLKAQRTAGRHRRFRRKDVDRLAAERGLRVSGSAPGRRRILVVEDDRQLAELIGEFLAGFADRVEVRFAFDGFEAGRQVESWTPDLILLDLMLPGMDGFDVCSRIRRGPEFAAVRIVAMTGYYTEENVRRVLEAGADLCLAKPFRRAEFVAALGLDATARVPVD